MTKAESSSFMTRNTRRKASHRRLKSSPVIALNTTPSTFIRKSIPSSSSTLPSLATHACKFYFDHLHQTLVCLLFTREAFTNLASIRSNNINRNEHYAERPARYNQRPGNQICRHLSNHRHQSSPSDRNTKVLQSAHSARLRRGTRI